MLIRTCIIVAGTLVILTPRHQAAAFLPRNPITLSVDVVANTTAESPVSECGVSTTLETYEKRAWWIAVAETATGSEIRCGRNAFASAHTESGEPSGHPHLIADVSTVAKLIRQMEDEQVLSVEVTVSVQTLSGFDDQQQPVYQPSEVRREFFFAEDANVLVPLLVASTTARPALGIDEVFLRLAARAVEHEEDAVYGSVVVTAHTPGAEILLDGGVVGEVPASKEITLRNVPVGRREVGMRDTTGHDIRTVVRVVGNRTVLVALGSTAPSEHGDRYRLVSLGKNAQGYEEYRREIDSATVVKVPAGEFLMGNKDTERTPLEHQVHVSEFLMDRTGVTWGQFKTFAAATGVPLPPHHPYWGIHDDHPAVYVTWEDAKAYCEWAGGRLPTEAEREKAARGTDRRKYPWGDEEPDPERGVFRRNWGKEATGAVGTHPRGASPYGLLDMGGNVWEWCADWYDGEYYAISPARDPRGPDSGRAHVVRGGSWDSRPSVLSASCRSWGHPGYRDGDFGFRCAMNAPP